MKRVLIALLYLGCLVTVALLLSSSPVEGQECPGTCGAAKAAQPASCATCPAKAAPVKQEVPAAKKACSGSCDTCESAAKPAPAAQEAPAGPCGGRGKKQGARAGGGKGRQQAAAGPGRGKGRGAGQQAAGGGRGQGRGRQAAQQGCGKCGGAQGAAKRGGKCSGTESAATGGGRGRGRQAASPGRGAGRPAAAQGRGQGRGRGRCGQTGRGAAGRGRGASCGLGAAAPTAPVQKAAEVTEVTEEPSPEEALVVEEAAPAKAYVARLQDALRGELYAHAYYLAAAEAFPGTRRFQNVARAESRHAKAVGQAIQMLGGTPVTAHGHQLVPPATAADAESEGQKIERQVIARFEALIRDCPEPAIKTLLEQLQAANYRHLRAMGG